MRLRLATASRFGARAFGASQEQIGRADATAAGAVARVERSVLRPPAARTAASVATCAGVSVRCYSYFLRVEIGATTRWRLVGLSAWQVVGAEPSLVRSAVGTVV